jgi:hypothetical protein
MRIKLLGIIMIFFSCTGAGDRTLSGEQDSTYFINDTNTVKVGIDTTRVFNQIKCDTTIKYDLEGISSEGAEADVCYFKNRMKRARITIYGSSGRVEVNYDFTGTSIKVREYTYIYLKPLSQIENGKDIKLESTSIYTLSNNGKVIDGNSNNAEDIYESFISTIPQVF